MSYEKKTFFKRTDHEVYFIEVKKSRLFTIGGKPKETLIKQLSVLHPGSIDDYIIDFFELYIGLRKWVMIHLIRRELFAELKILGYSRCLFTNTVSFFSVPKAATEICINFSNETIGIDENGVPYSDPIVTHESIQENFLPTKKGMLFYKKNTKKPKLVSSVILIAIIFVFIISFTFNHSSQKKHITSTTSSDSISEIQSKEVFFPDLFIVADRLSSAVFELNGIINSVSINGDTSFVSLDVSGCQPQKLVIELLTIEYFSSFQLSEIHYDGDSPRYTILLVKNPSLVFPPYILGASKNTLSSEIGENMRMAIIEAGAEIKSERNVSTTRSNSVDLIFKIQHVEFSRCAVALSQCANTFSVFPDFIQISPDRSLNQFTIHYRYYLTNDSKKTTYINSLHPNFNESFGLKNALSIVNKNIKTQALTISDGYEQVGSINEKNGVAIHYYRNKEGKILEITQ